MAQALSYLGYKYYKYNTEENRVIYSFERTPKFMEALHALIEIKKKYGNKYEE